MQLICILFEIYKQFIQNVSDFICVILSTNFPHYDEIHTSIIQRYDEMSQKFKNMKKYAKNIKNSKT